MKVPEFLFSHHVACDEHGREQFVTERYRVVRVTKKRVFVAREPEGRWVEQDGTFSFSRAAIEAGEVVGARGHSVLTSNPDPKSFWKAMSGAVLGSVSP